MPPKRASPKRAFIERDNTFEEILLTPGSNDREIYSQVFSAMIYNNPAPNINEKQVCKKLAQSGAVCERQAFVNIGNHVGDCTSMCWADTHAWHHDVFGLMKFLAESAGAIGSVSYGASVVDWEYPPKTNSLLMLRSLKDLHSQPSIHIAVPSDEQSPDRPKTLLGLRVNLLTPGAEYVPPSSAGAGVNGSTGSLPKAPSNAVHPLCNPAELLTSSMMSSSMMLSTHGGADSGPKPSIYTGPIAFQFMLQSNTRFLPDFDSVFYDQGESLGWHFFKRFLKPDTLQTLLTDCKYGECLQKANAGDTVEQDALGGAALYKAEQYLSNHFRPNTAVIISNVDEAVDFLMKFLVIAAGRCQPLDAEIRLHRTKLCTPIAHADIFKSLKIDGLVNPANQYQRLAQDRGFHELDSQKYGIDDSMLRNFELNAYRDNSDQTQLAIWSNQIINLIDADDLPLFVQIALPKLHFFFNPDVASKMIAFNPSQGYHVTNYKNEDGVIKAHEDFTQMKFPGSDIEFDHMLHENIAALSGNDQKRVTELRRILTAAKQLA